MLAALCLLGPAGSARAEDSRPSDETLRSLQERGRTLFLYLQAVERAGDLLKKRASEGVRPDRTVIIPDRAGWQVVFLQDLSKESTPTGPKKGMVQVAETTFSPDAGQVGDLTIMDPPHAAPATAQSYARALEQAESATVSRPDAGSPFEDAVIREKDATFTVYLISHRDEDGAAGARAVPPAGSVRFGRDFVIRLAASGRQVLSVEPLHSNATSVPLGPRAAGQPTLHVHVKGDLPFPTDVALVLRNRALAPHLVLTPRFMFRIDSEGAVTWLGPNTLPQTSASGGAP
ncbi:MAG: hypothetical protein AUH92_04185 [Acidobacteria bacterium 13_1_40CM_4_69_4]|nr:MAG: hypothetical protein AUH92_04185 [Acidobacteria bacterium 13_1_40CM_4_69_4]